jgi:hypothetical protein
MATNKFQVVKYVTTRTVQQFVNVWRSKNVSRASKYDEESECKFTAPTNKRQYFKERNLTIDYEVLTVAFQHSAPTLKMLVTAFRI